MIACRVPTPSGFAFVGRFLWKDTSCSSVPEFTDPFLHLFHCWSTVCSEPVRNKRFSVSWFLRSHVMTISNFFLIVGLVAKIVANHLAVVSYLQDYPWCSFQFSWPSKLPSCAVKLFRHLFCHDSNFNVMQRAASGGAIFATLKNINRCFFEHSKCTCRWVCAHRCTYHLSRALGDSSGCDKRETKGSQRGPLIYRTPRGLLWCCLRCPLLSCSVHCQSRGYLLASVW